MRRIVKKEQKGKKKESEKEEKHAVILKVAYLKITGSEGQNVHALAYKGIHINVNRAVLIR